MPHIKILKALHMTPKEWGQLPPETESPIRNELKEKAAQLIKDRESENPQSVHARLASIETRVHGLEFALEQSRLSKPQPEKREEG